MSKYGRMREGKSGLTKWLLQETLEEHDSTMEHPYMKTIYQRRADFAAYTLYLNSQRLIFEAMEKAVTANATHPVIGRIYDSDIERAPPLRSNVEYFAKKVLPTSKGGAHSHANIEPTPSARRYVEVLQADVEESVELLAVHHMLQYLAVLSGGQFLKTQLSKQMQSESIDDPNDGLTFYTFASIGVRGGSKFVSTYMDTFDSLAFTISRQRILECAKQVYALSDALMAECYAVAPVELEPETNTPVKPTEGPMLRLTSAELAEFDGVNQPRILLSIRGKLYDVTAGREMYGPSGSYSKFAGKDVTRALGSMDLSHEALDDLGWQPETSKEEKTLVDWEKKIGGKYPVCGDLIQLVRPRVITGGAAVKNEPTVKNGAVTDDGATTEAAATCPFSGAAAPPGAAGTCPFAGAAEKPAADDKGECPWPFVFLHDVQGGLHPKHRLKNAATVAIVAVVATAVVRYFL